MADSPGARGSRRAEPGARARGSLRLSRAGAEGAPDKDPLSPGRGDGDRHDRRGWKNRQARAHRHRRIVQPLCGRASSRRSRRPSQQESAKAAQAGQRPLWLMASAADADVYAQGFIHAPLPGGRPQRKPRWELCSRESPLEVVTCVTPPISGLPLKPAGRRRCPRHPLTSARAAHMDEQPPDAVDGLMHILIADDDPVSRVYSGPPWNAWGIAARSPTTARSHGNSSWRSARTC